jgi:hypothetical protein
VEHLLIELRNFIVSYVKWIYQEFYDKNNLFKNKDGSMHTQDKDHIVNKFSRHYYHIITSFFNVITLINNLYGQKDIRTPQLTNVDIHGQAHSTFIFKLCLPTGNLKQAYVRG